MNNHCDNVPGGMATIQAHKDRENQYISAWLNCDKNEPYCEHWELNNMCSRLDEKCPYEKTEKEEK